MSSVKQMIWILTTMLAMSGLLAACGGKAPVSRPIQTAVDGQIELVETKPEKPPVWIEDPSLESDQEYLAFRGMSLDAAHLREARSLAYQDARVTIGNYLFTHVDSRIVERLQSSGVSSDIYDPRITTEIVRDVSSDVFVRGAYPRQTYTEYFRRYERGRWVNYYRVQVLVKYPREQVASAIQEATQRALKRFTIVLNANKREEIQEKGNWLRKEISESADSTKLVSSPASGDIWALLVGIDHYKNLAITPLHFAAQDARFLPTP